MPDATPAYSIQHNPVQHRFETRVDGNLAKLDYVIDGAVMHITHTIVPRVIEGRGVAAALVAAALHHARQHDLKVQPDCPYAASYMERRPETRELLA